MLIKRTLTLTLTLTLSLCALCLRAVACGLCDEEKTKLPRGPRDVTALSVIVRRDTSRLCTSAHCAQRPVCSESGLTRAVYGFTLYYLLCKCLYKAVLRARSKTGQPNNLNLQYAT